MKNPKNCRYGIIQGRLTLPTNQELQCFPQNWKNEFTSAKKLGLSFIELFVERNFNSSNPIWSEIGRNEIIEESIKQNIDIFSSCSDYIISNSILSDHTILHLHNFIDASSKIGCELIILPLFGKSNVDLKDFIELKKIIRDLAKYSYKKNIIIGLETAFSPEENIELLEGINMRNSVKCVFDTGNRALLSEDIAGEIMQLGKWICHVHIKDKDYNDQNVTLGTGVINFMKIFNAFSYINYDGPFVFETVRGKDPLKTAQYNINFCDYFYNESL